MKFGEFYYVQPDWRLIPSTYGYSGFVNLMPPTTVADTHDSDPGTVMLLDASDVARSDGPAQIHLDFPAPVQVDAVGIFNTNLLDSTDVGLRGGASTWWNLPDGGRWLKTSDGRTPDIWFDITQTGDPATRTHASWMLSFAPIPPTLAIGEIWLCGKVGRLHHGISWGATYGITQPRIEQRTLAGARWRYGYGTRQRTFRGQFLTPSFEEWLLLQSWVQSCQGTKPTVIVPPSPPPSPGTDTLFIEPWMVHWTQDSQTMVRSNGWAHTMALEFDELSPGAPLP